MDIDSDNHEIKNKDPPPAKKEKTDVLSLEERLNKKLESESITF